MFLSISDWRVEIWTQKGKQGAFDRRQVGFRRHRQRHLVPVDSRDAATLLPIIADHVLPGTTIVTDEWRSYRRLPQLLGPAPAGYAHNRVNHHLNFVDPNDPAVHTQNVESMWCAAKRKFKHMAGTRKEGPHLESYLQEFMWRKQHGKPALMHFLNHVVQQYPLP